MAQGFSITGGAHNVVYGDQINNPMYNNFDSSVHEALKSVTAHAALNALHNSGQRFPPPNCLPGTRTKILADCNRWIMEQPASQRVFWIHGRAGVGKSAIMQNLSEQHVCKGKLLVGTQWPWHVCMRSQTGENARHRFAASFFFSRNDPTRDKLDPLVATIVYQFLTSEPLREVLGPLIIEAICQNPGVFQLSFEEQFRELILTPCLRVDPKSWENLPNLVVIDGIDECILLLSKERLIAIIREALPGCPLIFLVASRPEPRICQAFKHASFTSSLHHLLIGDSPESSRDITTYFHQQFTQLQETHHALHNLDSAWPGEEKIHQLVDRACGQFIFAKAVMTYLESDDDLPTERLDTILRIRVEDLSESPYPALDLLYHQILSTYRNWDEVREVLRLLITIPHQHLGPFDKPRMKKWSRTVERLRNSPCYTGRRYTDKLYAGKHKPSKLTGGTSFDTLPGPPPLLYLPCSSEYIETILGLKPGKVQSLLFRLHAVIEVPKVGSASIRISHTSFTEFLLDPARSQNYHVKEYTSLEYFDLVAQASLRAISVNSQEYCRSLSGLDPGFGLSHLSWNLLGSHEIPLLTSLGTQAPQTFIGKMESFLRSCRIASPPDTAAKELAKAVIHLEQCLYGLSSWYRIWFGKESSNENNIYILPPERQLPSPWSCYTVTCEKADIVKSLLESLSRCRVSMLEKDIHEDTYDSVHHLDSEKKNHLYVLKKLVAQRRQEFGLDPWPCTPPVTEDSLLDGAVNSFCRTDAILGEEDTNAVDEAGTRAEEANAATDSDVRTVPPYSRVFRHDAESGVPPDVAGTDSDRLQHVDPYEAIACLSNEEVGGEGDIFHLLFCVILPVLLILYYAILDIYA
ncbi:hypothetical protein VNI00_015865 [Paramarasmius palmivorus]|uniref:Nephrocystin 3-like N-terminal domain-containing protein n=1 Tax=Paramarasmius palmivorus TaxID=297713 RepID=A0AAW0BIE7_9AGAR